MPATPAPSICTKIAFLGRFPRWIRRIPAACMGTVSQLASRDTHLHQFATIHAHRDTHSTHKEDRKIACFWCIFGVASVVLRGPVSTQGVF